jgi:hypothetical protein
MRTFIIAILLSLPIAGACSDDSQCDKVASHFLKLAPEEMKSRVGSKAELAKRCEKDMSAEERSCALAAESFEDLLDCRNKK